MYNKGCDRKAVWELLRPFQYEVRNCLFQARKLYYLYSMRAESESLLALSYLNL